VYHVAPSIIGRRNRRISQISSYIDWKAHLRASWAGQPLADLDPLQPSVLEIELGQPFSPSEQPFAAGGDGTVEHVIDEFGALEALAAQDLCSGSIRCSATCASAAVLNAFQSTRIVVLLLATTS
jgi:hypothetical protein